MYRKKKHWLAYIHFPHIFNFANILASSEACRPQLPNELRAGQEHFLHAHAGHRHSHQEKVEVVFHKLLIKPGLISGLCSINC